MPEVNQTTTDQLMAQAQVFASAWSLIHGPFDRGNRLENAEEARDELREMIDDLMEQHSVQVEGMAESVQKLIDWHGRQTVHLESLLSAAKDGNTISLGGAENIELNSQSAYGMRIGIALSQHFLGKLPITLTRSE